MPTPMENYLFDLRGYLVLEGTVGPEQLQRINAAIDAVPPLENGEWWGNVQGHSYHNEIDGRNLQNIVEGGATFEELIDHPAWMDHVRTYVGRKEGLFIDECFVTLRGPSEGSAARRSLRRSPTASSSEVAAEPGKRTTETRRAVLPEEASS